MFPSPGSAGSLAVSGGRFVRVITIKARGPGRVRQTSTRCAAGWGSRHQHFEDAAPSCRSSRYAIATVGV
jgi:hypothetical protein